MQSIRDRYLWRDRGLPFTAPMNRWAGLPLGMGLNGHIAKNHDYYGFIRIRDMEAHWNAGAIYVLPSGCRRRDGYIYHVGTKVMFNKEKT